MRDTVIKQNLPAEGNIPKNIQPCSQQNFSEKEDNSDDYTRCDILHKLPTLLLKTACFKVNKVPKNKMANLLVDLNHKMYLRSTLPGQA